MTKNFITLLIFLSAVSALTCKKRDFSNPVDASVSLPAPSALAVASFTETGAVLQWKMAPLDPEYPNAPVMIVIERDSNGSGYRRIDSVTADVTTKTVAGIYQAGITYTFRIYAKAATNTSPSSYSASSTLVFDAPTALIVSSMTETSAVLQWKDNSSFETGFLIDRSADGVTYATVDSTGAGVTTKEVGGIYLPGVTYTFRVRARSVHQQTANAVSAGAFCALTAPAGLTIDALTETSATIRWAYTHTFETGFLIERCSDGVQYSVVDSAGAGAATKTIAGVYSLDSTYTFRVRARSLYHTSAYSAPASRSIFVRDVQMMPVAGGAFQMGSIAQSAEQPVHAVTVGSFYLDRCEITYEKWSAVRTWGAAHGYTDLGAGQIGSAGSGTNHPVTKVNWYDVVKWCNARSEMDGLTPSYYTSNTLTAVYKTGDLDLPGDAVKWTANGYRLPTEAEWEFAARGGTKTHGYLYSGSGSIGDIAWYYTNAANSTHPVGAKLQNELGLFDMSGNVEEWCWDWYGGYGAAAQTDPKGPLTGTAHVLRGGVFNNSVDNGFDCRVANRDSNGPARRDLINAGFRCAGR